MKDLVNKITNIAKAEIGVSEYPPNSNCVKYNTIYYGKFVKGSRYPWCCVFIWWIFYKANMSSCFFDGKKTASCPAVQLWAKTNNIFISKNPHVGDLVLFNFGGEMVPQHIGIITVINTDGTFATIEGNTGNKSQDNGGAVMAKKRYKKDIVGFVNMQKYYKNLEAKQMEELKQEIESLKKEIADLKSNNYNWTTACPAWSQPYIQKALELGIIKGDENGQLNLSLSDIRQITFLLRAMKIMK